MLISVCLILLPLYYIAPGRSAVTGSKDDGDNDDKFVPGLSFYRQTVKCWLFLQDKIFVNRYELIDRNKYPRNFLSSLLAETVCKFWIVK